MGEYALYNGHRTKIGTCEDMYYLRYDQRHQVHALSGNVDPVRDATSLRFRFPWPDEDNTPPGGFDRHDRSLGLHGVKPPEGITHYSIQFKANAGYLVSLPCPESEKGKRWAEDTDTTFHRNGFSGSVKIVQQKPDAEGNLMLICQCGGCGVAYRLETLADAEDVLKVLDAANARQADDARNWGKVAQRIRDGYNIADRIAREQIAANFLKDGDG